MKALALSANRKPRGPDKALKSSGAKMRTESKGEPQTAPKARLDTTVTKAMLLFETLAASDTPMGISTISKVLSLQKSNVHRLLNTLAALGYVEQDLDTKRYFPSLKVWEIGSAIANRSLLRVAAHPILLELHRETSEAVFLSILSDTHVLYLDAISAPNSPAGPRLGDRAPAVFPASGKVMLANQHDPEGIVDRVIAMVPQAAALKKSALLREFEDIRHNGYAVSTRGWRSDNTAVAAAVMGFGAPPSAAVGIGGTVEHMTKRRISQVIRPLLEAASKIARLPIPPRSPVR
ncbi:MAG: IclR family transcriptional regulator [Rhizomicrobium sp.]